MLKYGEYIIHQLVSSKFIKNKLVDILISIIVNTIQLHLVTIISLLTSINLYVDFISQIVISVIISINNNYLYNAVERYKPELNVLANKIITNYNINNYCYWKRIIIIFICVYLLFLLFFIEINTMILRIYIIQYLIGYFIIESYQKRIFHKYINDNILKRPKVVCQEQTLIDSYLSTIKDQSTNSSVQRPLQLKDISEENQNESDKLDNSDWGNKSILLSRSSVVSDLS